MKRGKVYLIPTPIADGTSHSVIPPQVIEALRGLKHFLAENVRTSRRYLSSLKIYESIEALNFEVLDKDTKYADLEQLLAPIEEGFSVGILSESGCPGIADPGAVAVKFAHAQDIKVIPLVGPSSILLALMGSGLNGQCFAFQGYLPIPIAEAAKRMKDFEQESKQKGQTQIFIETPYRSNTLFQLFLKTLKPETQLCLAVDVTGEMEEILTRSVKQWRVMDKVLLKTPTVFLFLSS